MFSLLQGKQPDKVPWFGDLDYWANSLIKRGLKPNDFVTSDAYLDWHHSLGVGYYLQGHFPFKEIMVNCGNAGNIAMKPFRRHRWNIC